MSGNRSLAGARKPWRRFVIGSIRRLNLVGRLMMAGLWEAKYSCHGCRKVMCCLRLPLMGTRPLWYALTMIRSADRSLRDRAAQRLRQCRRCPLFHRPLLSCGWAGGPKIWHNPRTKTVEAAGCFCLMDLKAFIPDASCWLYENTDGEMGWPEHLNGPAV